MMERSNLRYLTCGIASLIVALSCVVMWLRSVFVRDFVSFRLAHGIRLNIDSSDGCLCWSIQHTRFELPMIPQWMVLDFSTAEELMEPYPWKWRLWGAGCVESAFGDVVVWTAPYWMIEAPLVGVSTWCILRFSRVQSVQGVRPHSA